MSNEGKALYWLIKTWKATRLLKYMQRQAQWRALRAWKPWECWLIGKLDFRYWRCECHYQPPFGKVIMGGCPKHD